MIKVIKHGEKTFRVICPKCGCEFEYQLEDIGTTIPAHIACPDCGEYVEHKKFTDDEKKQPDIFWSNPYGYIPCSDHPSQILSGGTSVPADPCKNCINKDGPKDVFGNPIAGDSPCDWCRYSKRRVTCINY